MEKYYFHQMKEESSENNWFIECKPEFFTEDELKKGYLVDEYGLKHKIIPLSGLKKYLKEHPNEWIYEETLENIDEETKKYLSKEIPMKKTFINSVKNN